MNAEDVKALIEQGEGLRVEFKSCRSALSRDVYETVCAFLNRVGGDILLGVADSGEVHGIEPDCVEQLKQDFVTAVNNAEIINPPCYLSINNVMVDDKELLHVFVPESSQVHHHKGRIFDRNEDGDLDITRHQSQVTSLYFRKQTTYTETTIYPGVTSEDFRPDLIARARKRAVIQNPKHPWGDMSDLDLLKSAQLYGRDYKERIEGFNLAAVLLLGRDNVVLSVLPHHRTDALLRRVNLDRYDDRDDIRTNLIDSYDRLMAFVGKHLPDKFFLESDQRISIRDHIFREVVANSLIHREYMNAFPAKLIIGTHMVVSENGNKPHGQGLIDPQHFSPHPKNPIIAAFFRAMGWADELGSGVRKLKKYCRFYGGGDAQFVEGDIFRITVPLSVEVAETPGKTPETPGKTPETPGKTPETPGKTDGENRRGKTKASIIRLLKEAPKMSIPELAKRTERTESAVQRALRGLQKSGRLKRVGPDKGGHWEVVE